MNPETGVQDAETTNSGTDRLVLPQRPALTPDGDVVVSDFTLDDLEGGLVSVDLPDGGQSILRQDRQLFNNPLGVAVVANREPVAALSVSPAKVAGGRQVSFDASGSRDPEGLQLRYAWDLDGNGSFETDGGTSPTITHAYSGTTTFTPRVRVSDPHGASGVAGAPLSVDSIRPVISGAQGPRLHDHLPALRARARDDPAPAAEGQALAHDPGAAPERRGREEPPAGAEPGARGEADPPRALPRRGGRGRRGRQPLAPDTAAPLGKAAKKLRASARAAR